MQKPNIIDDNTGFENIEIHSAREHNLNSIDLSFPRNAMVIFTGISGSGKSSLAFDTIYAEGQRRYMESFSAYARSFMGDMKRPEVDKIEGLSPVISIEQKTTSRNPRSTVGTTTEIYDFLRLLYARAGEAFSYKSGEKMVKQTEEQMMEHLFKNFEGKKVSMLSPVVKGRKGHYREVFEQLRKQGYLKARIDGVLTELVPKMQLDRYKIHDIELVVDRFSIRDKDRFRISQSLKLALDQGKGMASVLDEEGNHHHYSKTLTDPSTGISYDEPAPNSFSFNSPYGACEKCNGLGKIEEFTEEGLIEESSKSIVAGAIPALGDYRDVWIFKKIDAVLKLDGYGIETPLDKISSESLKKVFYGTNEEIAVASVKHPGTDWNTSYKGLIAYFQQQVDFANEKTQKLIRTFMKINVCPKCKGARLKQESLNFFIDGKNISQLTQFSLSELSNWFENLESRLSDKQNLIATEILKEIRKRLGFILGVGLEYLSLDRSLKTLSGGEAQRIRLATQIATQLVGVLYILDEPSIGLHQRDNVKLIQALKDLRDLGNSVIVVEHDKDMMLESDYIVDIGPGAGIHGGNIVAHGTPEEFLKQNSLTAQYLSEKIDIVHPDVIRTGNGKFLTLKGAKGHNLKNITLKLPLGKMICVTGVSGSGKSSLIHETLYPILSKHFYRSKTEALEYEKIEGLENLDKVIEVDQSPIGRTPRSNPATYTGMFTEIRSIFTNLPESKIRGYKPGRFSFNVKGGRCETCRGGGKQIIEMDFLPDVHIDCNECKGKRYNRQTLEVRYKSKSISDVLEMTIEQAIVFFEPYPKILRILNSLNDVGLGYITLGQHATTLSGGEAQRVKLASELSKKDTGKTLYILDEPTTGLHFQDINNLLNVLNRLTDKGNTVLIIEHNLDVVKVSDHIIDIGPEGGEAGGQIVCQGTPTEVSKNRKSYTAKFLKLELKSKNSQ